MKKLRVAVLMGGKSAEHEISLVTGREVVKNLNPRKYDVLPIVVSRDGLTWQITSNEKKVGLPTIKNMTEPAKLKKGQQSMKRDAGAFGASLYRIRCPSFGLRYGQILLEEVIYPSRLDYTRFCDCQT
ncbi:hypothetical protein HYS90_01255 [Candidatus Curtissbacteria bacterium]|nr:hypothetical protein [Candidatus Curtissbacteria bacterium]